MHKILWVMCSVFLVLVAADLAIHFLITGFRIMLFGAGMFLFPLIVAVIAYMLWHIRKFG